jgi:hypothetical protein
MQNNALPPRKGPPRTPPPAAHAARLAVGWTTTHRCSSASVSGTLALVRADFTPTITASWTTSYGTLVQEDSVLLPFRHGFRVAFCCGAETYLGAMPDAPLIAAIAPMTLEVFMQMASAVPPTVTRGLYHMNGAASVDCVTLVWLCPTPSGILAIQLPNVAGRPPVADRAAKTAIFDDTAPKAVIGGRAAGPDAHRPK